MAIAQGAYLEDVDKFNREILAYSRELLPRQVVALQKNMALRVLRGVVMKTPVDTGRARGNWQVNIGSVPEVEVESEEKGPRGKAPQGASGGVFDAGQAVIKSLPSKRPFHIVWITNNVPYILRLEEGYSDQAPQGMLGLTLVEVAERISAEIGGSD